MIERVRACSSASRLRVKSSHSFRWESNEATATRSWGSSPWTSFKASRCMRSRPPMREDSRSFWKKKTMSRPSGAGGAWTSAAAGGVSPSA